MELSDVVRSKGGSLEVDIIVSPRSNRSGPEGFDEWRKRLIVRVKAPPLDGRANKEVEEIFRRITGFRCEVTSGLRNHQKTVTVSGDPSLAMDAIQRSLG